MRLILLFQIIFINQTAFAGEFPKHLHCKEMKIGFMDSPVLPSKWENYNEIGISILNEENLEIFSEKKIVKLSYVHSPENDYDFDSNEKAFPGKGSIDRSDGRLIMHWLITDQFRTVVQGYCKPVKEKPVFKLMF